jgi:hypothetical protein
MELQQPMLDLEQLIMTREAVSAQKQNQNHSKSASPKSTRNESSGTPEMGVPWNYSAEQKIYWLRSQIIGGDAEIDTPLGKRRLTYADHTASGRPLRYIENMIIDNVLPFYGNLLIKSFTIFLID